MQRPLFTAATAQTAVGHVGQEERQLVGVVAAAAAATVAAVAFIGLPIWPGALRGFRGKALAGYWSLASAHTHRGREMKIVIIESLR